MKITDMTDREQIANELKERLRWLEDNTVDEEYNIREAAAIKQLLRIMEPAEPDWDAAYFEPASAEQRFWDTYETRVDIEQEKEKLLTGRLDMEPDLSENILVKTEEGEKKPAQPQKKNLFLYFATHRWAAAAWIAVVLTVVILASGTVGAYAQSRGGIFHFFQNDEEGMKGIVAPDGIGKEENFYRLEQYTRIEDIPEKYRNKFYFAALLQDQYNVDYIKILDYSKFIFYEAQISEIESDSYIIYDQKYYIDKVAYMRQANDDYSYEGVQKVNEIEIRYYKSKKDNIYVATFAIDKSFIAIYGNVEEEKIKEITVNLIKSYLKF